MSDTGFHFGEVDRSLLERHRFSPELISQLERLVDSNPVGVQPQLACDPPSKKEIRHLHRALTGLVERFDAASDGLAEGIEDVLCEISVAPTMDDYDEPPLEEFRKLGDTLRRLSEQATEWREKGFPRQKKGAGRKRDKRFDSLDLAVAEALDTHGIPLKKNGDGALVPCSRKN